MDNLVPVVQKKLGIPPPPRLGNDGDSGSYATELIQEQIILKRGGRVIVNQGFDETDSAPVGAGATYSKMLSITVPQSSDQVLVITHYGNFLSDVVAWGLFTWNMYIDAVPVQSYYNVKSQLGQPSQMRKVGVDIIVGSGQTLYVDVISTAGVQYNAGISLLGVYGNYDYGKG